MELCLEPEYGNYFKSPNSKEQFGESLIQKLRTLHAFQVVQGDIKTDNVVWSSESKRLLFIDFGFSRMLEETQVGVKTKTSFFGTPQYASPEMRKYYLLNQAGLVDLYFNDWHALKITLQKLQNNCIKDSREGSENFLWSKKG